MPLSNAGALFAEKVANEMRKGGVRAGAVDLINRAGGKVGKVARPVTNPREHRVERVHHRGLVKIVHVVYVGVIYIGCLIANIKMPTNRNHRR